MNILCRLGRHRYRVNFDKIKAGETINYWSVRCTRCGKYSTKKSICPIKHKVRINGLNTDPCSLIPIDFPGPGVSIAAKIDNVACKLDKIIELLGKQQEEKSDEV